MIQIVAKTPSRPRHRGAVGQWIARHKIQSADRIERSVAKSYEIHPQRHTRRYRRRVAAIVNVGFVAIISLWSGMQITDLWSHVTDTPLAAWLYLALMVLFVVTFMLQQHLSIALDGVTRLPMERLDELQRDVRQRANDRTLNVLIWAIVLLFFSGALLLTALDLPDQLTLSLLICGIYALSAIAMFSSTTLVARWLPDEDNEDLDRKERGDLHAIN